MIMRLFFLMFFLNILFGNISGQQITVSGLVLDGESGEVLIGANIYVATEDVGTVSNQYGFYSITINSSDSLGLVYSFLGYSPQIKKVMLQGDLRLDVELFPQESVFDEVVITSGRSSDNVSRPLMGVLDVPIAQINEIPAILGEVDLLKVIQLLPGVQSGNEGTTAFHVRGGNADQNLVQLDESIVYNPNHLFGLLSAFNSRAINNVNLIKGGFPARYGGRLSSILDVNMKEGNKRRVEVDGGIGLLTSQLSVQGPLKREISSFIVSARRTYFDYLIKPFLPKSVSTSYAFYDVNAKLNWKVGSNDHIYLSYFNGLDDAYYTQDGIRYDILFGNNTGTLRWNHIYNKRLFLNTSISVNRYNQSIAALQDNSRTRVSSDLVDVTAKIGLQYSPSPNHFLRFGLQFFDHTFRSEGDTGAQSSIDAGPGAAGKIPSRYFDELALFASDEVTFSDNFSLYLGLRFPAFLSTDVHYFRMEPRASMKYSLTAQSSVKASYCIMNQFVHLIPSSTAAVPTDIWVPSTRRTRPQYSQQISLGYYRNFDRNAIETSIETYYKSMDNQVLFREGNQLVSSIEVDPLLVYGRGWSYGAELLVKKNAGKLSGWIGYTLSWTYQKFADLNFGNKFPFRHDRRHDLSVVGIYQFNDHWKFSGTFVLSSGNTFTVPVGRSHVHHGGTLFEGNYFIYENRNNARLQPFHRLNLSFSHTKKDAKFFGSTYEREWVFSLYNTYNRQNPYFIYFQVDPLSDLPKTKQVSLLPVLPSLSFNFKF